MKYYREKERGLKALEELVKKRGKSGISRQELTYLVASGFFIGEITIKKRVDTLIDIGKIKEEFGVLIWKK